MELINTENAIDQLATPAVFKQPMLPIFEAIHNSIHSIIQSETPEGKIIVKVQRKPVDGDLVHEVITDVVITDNGVGFNDKNTKAYFQLFCDNKKAEFDSKGIGRLTYYVSFSEVAISSVFALNGEYLKRNFKTDKANICSGDIPKHEPENEKKYPVTSVHLKNLRPDLLELYKSISPDILIDSIQEHFIASLLSVDTISIEINDGKIVTIDRNSFQSFKGKPFIIQNEIFDVFHIKRNPATRSNHTITLSASGREVESKKIDFLPGIKIGERDDKFYHNL